MNEVGANCPVFVAANLAKLPVITADAFNLAKMSKGISSVLNIEQNVHNTLASLACFQNDFQTVLEKCSKIDNIAENLNNLKSAAKNAMQGDSLCLIPVHQSRIPPLRGNNCNRDDTDHNNSFDSDDSNDNDDSSNMMTEVVTLITMMTTMTVRMMTASLNMTLLKHSSEALSPHKAEAFRIPDTVVPVLRLNDRPPHLNAWMQMVGSH